MSNVRHFAADCLQHATHVEAIAAIPALESLSLGVFDLESFRVLDGVSAALSRLFLGATRSMKPSLAPLRRFTKLRELSLEGQQKDIEVLAQMDTLEDLTLRSITTSDLRYLIGASRLWSLDIKLGGIRDLSAIRDLPDLEYLELWQIRGLSDISVISDLGALQNLFLQSLPRIESIPRLERCGRLRRIVLQNLRGLRDLSALESAPALEEFLLVQGETLTPEAVTPVLRNPAVAQASAFFGSDARNVAFAAMARASGKSEFQRSPFEYR